LTGHNAPAAKEDLEGTRRGGMHQLIRMTVQRGVDNQVNRPVQASQLGAYVHEFR
jgi:hypothetical protein